MSHLSLGFRHSSDGRDAANVTPADWTDEAPFFEERDAVRAEDELERCTTQLAHPTSRSEEKETDMVGKLVSIGFWGGGLSLTVAALVIPGGLIFLMLPLGGFVFLVFWLLTLTGTSNAPPGGNHNMGSAETQSSHLRRKEASDGHTF
jgi:hypothetical protein